MPLVPNPNASTIEERRRRALAALDGIDLADDVAEALERHVEADRPVARGCTGCLAKAAPGQLTCGALLCRERLDEVQGIADAAAARYVEAAAYKPMPTAPLELRRDLFGAVGRMLGPLELARRYEGEP